VIIQRPLDIAAGKGFQMKSESEIFCKDSFDRYLKSVKTGYTYSWRDVESKDEPPDFYLSVNATTYAVEVTILVKKEDVEARKNLPATTVRYLLRKFVVQEIEEEARKKDYLRGAYLVGFSKPISDFAKARDLMRTELLSYISATQGLSEAPEKTVCERGRQRCTIRKLNIGQNKIIVAGPSLSTYEGEALAEAKELIENRLKEKEYRLRRIAYPKVLLLHDKYYLSDGEIYRAAITKVSCLQSFHTIFLTGSGVESQVLYSTNPAWIYPEP